MKVLFLAVFSVLILCGSVSAYTQISIYVDNAGGALFLGQSNDSITLPEGITLQNGEVGGYTSALTKKDGDLWTFSYELSGTELNVILPTGTVVKNLFSGEIYLIGKQIGVYSNDQVKVSYTITPVESSNNTRLIIVLVLLLVMAVVGYIYWFRKGSRAEKKVVRKKVVKKEGLHPALENVLNEREKIILNKLREVGKTKSSYLRRALDIPKASFSRHIHELEKKKLVRLSGEGKNKFVELQKDGKPLLIEYKNKTITS